MLIKKAIETKDGVVTFDGELSGEELAKVLEVGLTVLVQLGVLTPSSEDKPND